MPLPSLSNSSLSPLRTPRTRRTSRGTVICPLLVIVACFGIPHPMFLTLPRYPYSGWIVSHGSAAAEVDVASRASAAEKCSSVEIAGRIAGHTGFRPSPVRKITAAVKRIKLSEMDRLCRRRLNQEETGH
jgi:hypothetical protein